MKKKFTITLLAQTVVIFMLFIFVIVQKMEADRQLEEAQMQKRKIENQQKLILTMQTELDKMRASYR